MAGPVAPPPLLHAAHGDGHLGLGRHQYGHIKDAVLLGAHQLLAIQERERQVPEVGHAELGHGAAFGDLRDARAVASLAQGEPLGLRLHGRQDGDDGQRAAVLRLVGQDAAKGLREDLDVGDCGHREGHGPVASPLS